MCSKFKDFFKLKPELPLLTKSYDICNKCEKSAISPSEFDLVWLPYSSGATVPLYVLSLSQLFCILEIAVDCRIPLGCISCYISVNVSLAFMFFLGDFATLWMVACSSIFLFRFWWFRTMQEMTTRTCKSRDLVRPGCYVDMWHHNLHEWGHVVQFFRRSPLI